MANRLAVQKTYKLFIGGKFPRTESGRYIKVNGADGKLLANICRSSRKDVREAVVAARKAFFGWSQRPAFNRSQVIYRVAEMLEGRKDQFAGELMNAGQTKAGATKEVEQAVDRLVYYAGWADKYQQVFSSVNPVAGSYFNFSVLEPTGVVGFIINSKHPLLGFVSSVVPAITGGNTVVAVCNPEAGSALISFAEALATSDLPGGVINILTGLEEELASHMAGHMDINALQVLSENQKVRATVEENAHVNVKRIKLFAETDVFESFWDDPYLILETQETKTTWHPVEQIGGSKSGY